MSQHARSAAPSASPAAPVDVRAARRWALLAIGVLGAKRIAYHLAYLVSDPFALATVSDGQLYEEAARDILAHPPLGSEPFYLQGLYAYLLALPMAVAGQVVVGLLLQLVCVAAGLFLFHRAATRLFGQFTGSLSTIVLLSFPNLAFYENKYLSVALGVTCNILALWAFVRCLDARRNWPFLVAGVAAGLSALGRPNLLLALPFTACAVVLVARARRRRPGPLLGLFGLGLVLALSPMALRNLAVTGQPDITPSHGGGIPFYIGNNPHANGRWNTAGGLLSGQVYREQSELWRELGLPAPEPEGGADVRAVGRELYRRGFEFIRDRPLDWLLLTARKLWLTLGNHPFVRDYDLNGEKELIGAFHHVGLPFGIVLGLGVLGLLAVAVRARERPTERGLWHAVLLVLGGQVFAVMVANLVFFTSAQNRVPLVVPLAFVAGPALIVTWARLRRASGASWKTGTGPLVLAGLLALQAFWPRLPESERPSSVHYYNLATVQEVLGRKPAAAENYWRAAERNPRQPVFLLAHARLSRELGRIEQARQSLERLLAFADLDPAVKRAALIEAARLQAAQREVQGEE